jgi:hypothetical protein
MGTMIETKATFDALTSGTSDQMGKAARLAAANGRPRQDDRYARREHAIEYKEYYDQ